MRDPDRPIPPVRRKYLIALLAIVLPLMGRDRMAIEPDPWAGVNGLRKLIQTMQEIKGRAAKYPGDAKLFQAAAQAMIAQVDDKYTSLHTQQNYQDIERVIDDAPIGGIGIVSTPETGLGILIDQIIPRSAAADAGLRPGDVIVAVDGQSIVDDPWASMSERLLGPVGTPVKITCQRGEDEFDVTLNRWAFPTRTVSGVTMMRGDPDIGYAHLQVFSHDAAKLLESELASLRRRGAKGFVLDLRGNVGGEMDAGVAVADLFLAKGIVTTVQRGDGSGQWRTGSDGEKIYRAKAGDAFEGIPLVVLIDGGTASAAELVAGALRDNGRALLVGTKTFGKARVQELMRLGQEDSRGGGALRITAARFLTPKGVDFEGVGLEPDRPVKLTPAEEDALRRNLVNKWLGLASALPRDPVLDLGVGVLRGQIQGE